MENFQKSKNRHHKRKPMKSNSEHLGALSRRETIANKPIKVTTDIVTTSSYEKMDVNGNVHSAPLEYNDDSERVKGTTLALSKRTNHESNLFKSGKSAGKSENSATCQKKIRWNDSPENQLVSNNYLESGFSRQQQTLAKTNGSNRDLAECKLSNNPHISGNVPQNHSATHSSDTKRTFSFHDHPNKDTRPFGSQNRNNSGSKRRRYNYGQNVHDQSKITAAGGQNKVQSVRQLSSSRVPSVTGDLTTNPASFSFPTQNTLHPSGTLSNNPQILQWNLMQNHKITTGAVTGSDQHREYQDRQFAYGKNQLEQIKKPSRQYRNEPVARRSNPEVQSHNDWRSSKSLYQNSNSGCKDQRFQSPQNVNEDKNNCSFKRRDYRIKSDNQIHRFESGRTKSFNKSATTSDFSSEWITIHQQTQPPNLESDLLCAELAKKSSVAGLTRQSHNSQSNPLSAVRSDRHLYDKLSGAGQLLGGQTFNFQTRLQTSNLITNCNYVANQAQTVEDTNIVPEILNGRRSSCEVFSEADKANTCWTRPITDHSLSYTPSEFEHMATKCDTSQTNQNTYYMCFPESQQGPFAISETNPSLGDLPLQPSHLQKQQINSDIYGSLLKENAVERHLCSSTEARLFTENSNDRLSNDHLSININRHPKIQENVTGEQTSNDNPIFSDFASGNVKLLPDHYPYAGHSGPVCSSDPDPGEQFKPSDTGYSNTPCPDNSVPVHKQSTCSASFNLSIRDEMEEEMTRAYSMSIPVNIDSKKSMRNSQLNPNAYEFCQKLTDSYGKPFYMTKQKGVCYFLPDAEHLKECSPHHESTNVYVTDSIESSIFSPVYISELSHGHEMNYIQPDTDYSTQNNPYIIDNYTGVPQNQSIVSCGSPYYPVSFVHMYCAPSPVSSTPVTFSDGENGSITFQMQAASHPVLSVNVPERSNPTLDSAAEPTNLIPTAQPCWQFAPIFSLQAYIESRQEHTSVTNDNNQPCVRINVSQTQTSNEEMQHPEVHGGETILEERASANSEYPARRDVSDVSPSHEIAATNVQAKALPLEICAMQEYKECKKLFQKLHSRKINLDQIRLKFSSEPELQRRIMERCLEIAHGVLEASQDKFAVDEMAASMLFLSPRISCGEASRHLLSQIENNCNS